jgi:hypothetical protein
MTGWWERPVIKCAGANIPGAIRLNHCALMNFSRDAMHTRVIFSTIR